MIYGPKLLPLRVVRAPSWARVGAYLYWAVNRDGKAIMPAEFTRKAALAVMQKALTQPLTEQ